MSEKNAATKVVIGPVRFSHLHVFEKWAGEDGSKEKYQVALLISKSDTKTINAVNAAIDAAKAVGKSSKWEGKIPAKLDISFRDGDVEKPDKPEYAGHFYISAKSDTQPFVLDKNRQPIVNRDEIYSGAFGYASITFYPYNKPKNGVAVGLNSVMKTKDGERFGYDNNPDEDYANIVFDEEDDLI